MSVYALTPLATADIFNIWSYIADDSNSNSEDTANRVEQAIYDACAFVTEAPLRGHSRSDLTSRRLRFWTLTRYRTTPSFTGPRRLPFRLSPFCTGKEI
jgi:plasmid stabilization system protein ParE